LDNSFASRFAALNAAFIAASTSKYSFIAAVGSGAAAFCVAKFYEGLTHFKTSGNGWTRKNQETLEQEMGLIG